MIEDFLALRLDLISSALTALDAAKQAAQADLDHLDAAPLSPEEREQRRTEIQALLDSYVRIAAALTTEQAALSSAPVWQTASEAFLRTAYLWLDMLGTIEGPHEIMALVRQDPVLLALGQDPSLTDELAVRVLSVPSLPGEDWLLHMDGVQSNMGNADAFIQLVHTSYRLWMDADLEQRPYLANDVGVLLPIRIETVFDHDEAANTTILSLRLIPDEASICRHIAAPTQLEMQKLAAFWQTIYDGFAGAAPPAELYEWLDTPQGKIAWQTLCDQLGPERASWLIAQYPAQFDGTPPTLPQVDEFSDNTSENRVGGLPDVIEIWAAFNGQQAQILERLPVDQSALTLKLFSNDPTIKRWWENFDDAIAVGLGVRTPLPDHKTADDIDCIYAIGISEESPLEHFREQVNAGEMATMKLGEPTNAVDGKTAAKLGKGAGDWQVVAQRRLQKQRNPLSLWLTGDADGLWDMPDAANIWSRGFAPAHSYAPDLVKALWPALWGHFWHDVWGIGDTNHQIGLWATDGRYDIPLQPEGPFPPIRIRRQPYGLLPVTRLDKWTVLPQEGETAARAEEQMQHPLIRMRSDLANAVRNTHLVVKTSTDTLIDLIQRDAVSDRYAYRFFLPWQTMATIVMAREPITVDQFIAALKEQVAPTEQAVGLDFDEKRPYPIAFGRYDTLNIPLIIPIHFPPNYYENPDLSINLRSSPEQSYAQLVNEIIGGARGLPNPDYYFGLWDHRIPDSLLIRLMVYANALSAAYIVDHDRHGDIPVREPLVSNTIDPSVLQQLTSSYDPAAAQPSAARSLRERQLESLSNLGVLGSIETSITERAFRATLDTASHRIDPWITGFAWRRLRYLANRPTTRYRIGVYGWVDGPIEKQRRGPREDLGMLHAPSQKQALAGIILRDKFVSGQALNEAGSKAYNMQLESRLVRLADEFADEARLGSHIYEIIGRRIEALIDTDQHVKDLRRKYPMNPARPNDYLTSVCHGKDALAGLLADPATPTPMRESLNLLQQVVDTYGDLLVAEAVYDVVSGRGEIAGAAMDASSGLSSPPNLEIAQTHISGNSINTSVLTVLPFVAADDLADPDNHPGILADASVASLLIQSLEASDQWDWATDANRITLADLALEPIDTVALSSDLLNKIVRFKLGADPDPALTEAGAKNHRLARELVRMLGSHPALYSDIDSVPPAGSPDASSLDLNIAEQLLIRYNRLRQAALQLQSDLQPDDDPVDENRRRIALLHSLRWGITPMTTEAEETLVFQALFDNVEPDDPSLLRTLSANAFAALQARLDAADPAKLLKPQDIARAIAELAAPEGQLAVFSPMDADTLVSRTQIATMPDSALDNDWLSVVSSVRPYLARLEALQLEASIFSRFDPFVGWSNSPDDHWREQLFRAKKDTQINVPRFVAAYTPRNVFPTDAAHPQVAVALLDSWSEAIPMQRHVTTAAFGFNAPAARAQQVILQAVPPELYQTLDTETLIHILQETRELSHARAARPQDLSIYQGVQPSMMFEANVPAGVHLGSRWHFDD